MAKVNAVRPPQKYVCTYNQNGVIFNSKTVRDFCVCERLHRLVLHIYILNDLNVKYSSLIIVCLYDVQVVSVYHSVTQFQINITNYDVYTW